jgi:hypothetical protein
MLIVIGLENVFSRNWTAAANAAVNPDGALLTLES